VLALLRRNRDLRLLFASQVISLGGDWFATVALLGLIGDLTHDNAVLKGLVFVAQSLPAFLVTPWAGPTADRFDRRKIMLVVSGLQALATLLFLLIGPGRVWVAFVAISIVTALSAFFGPASSAAMANLVDRQDLAKATSLLSATWGVMLAVGASLGAVFSQVFGRRAAFVADALSFVAAGLLIVAIKRKTRAADVVGADGHRPRLRPVHDTREALAFARTDRGLLALLCSKGGFGLSSGVVGVLSVLATRRFGGGDGAIGTLLGARGVGVVLGPILASHFGTRDVPGILRICAYSCITYGICYIGVGHAPVLAVAAVLTVLAHLGGGAQWTLSTIGLTLATPDALRGRIMAADFALVMLSTSLSYVVGGVLASTAGPTTAFTVLGSLSIVWGACYLRLTRTLRGDTPQPASNPTA